VWPALRAGAPAIGFAAGPIAIAGTAPPTGVQHPHVANQRKALVGRLCTHDEDVGPGELHDPDCIVT
jgi:hypothetical protein